MGTEFFIAVDVLPLELLACQVLNGLCCKLTEIALFIFIYLTLY